MKKILNQVCKKLTLGLHRIIINRYAMNKSELSLKMFKFFIAQLNYVFHFNNLLLQENKND